MEVEEGRYFTEFHQRETITDRYFQCEFVDLASFVAIVGVFVFEVESGGLQYRLS